jgi:hypothetical protein
MSISKKVILSAAVIFFQINLSAQIGAGYKPVEQPQIQYEQMQANMLRRQAVHDYNYQVVIKMLTLIKSEVKTTNDKTFIYEANLYINQLNQLKRGDLSGAGGKIDRIQKRYNKSVIRCNKRLSRKNRKR